MKDYQVNGRMTETIICENCGEEVLTVYVDWGTQVIGCRNCIPDLPTEMSAKGYNALRKVQTHFKKEK